MLTGTVRQTGGGVYEVALDDGRVVETSLRGRLKLEERTGSRVVIGDRVHVAEGDEGSATIEEVLPRRTELARRGAGGRGAKILAANVDRVVVVVAALKPEARGNIIDRLLVVGEVNDLESVLVINKLDLDGAPQRARPFSELYRGIGYRVIETSAVSGVGLEDLREVLSSGTSALVGPSGAGKSSLLNALEPGLNLRIGEVSKRRGRGRHTTVSSRLIVLPFGGCVADTPGFSDVGVWGAEPEALDHCFPEFAEAMEECAFRNCTHLHEPDCGVREKLDEGEIDPGRYGSYRVLMEEAEAPGY
jgi:ribosome biogenesis GTPase